MNFALKDKDVGIDIQMYIVTKLVIYVLHTILLKQIRTCRLLQMLCTT